MSKNIVTLKSGSEVTQGHSKLYHSVDRVWYGGAQTPAYWPNPANDESSSGPKSPTGKFKI